MTYRVKNIAVAVGLALCAVLLTTFYVTNYKRHVRQSEATVSVYVAKKDIPSGTPGADLLRSGLIVPEQVSQRTVVPGAISNPDQVRNLLTKDDTFAGEQITLRRFADNAEEGVRVQLHGQLRALSVPGTPDELLSGTLKDGDHVDLVANLKVNGQQYVRDVAQDILVLRAASESTAAKVSTGGQSSSSVLLAVSDRKDAQKIWFAVNNSGGWSLLLRPVAGATTPPVDVEGNGSMLHDGASQTAIAHATQGGVGQ
jgi:Flp pilus assembly protein CpaB